MAIVQDSDGIFNLDNGINEEKFKLTETVVSNVVLPPVESSQRNQRYAGYSTAEGHPIHFQEQPVKETELNKATRITIVVTWYWDIPKKEDFKRIDEGFLSQRLTCLTIYSFLKEKSLTDVPDRCK